MHCYAPGLCTRGILFFEVMNMAELWQTVQENISFVAMCIVIVAALALLAKAAEHFLPDTRKVTPAKRVAIVGICSAIAAVLHILDFSLVFLAPEFYKLDFSELPVMLCGFYLGPAATVACEGVKILLKLLLKGTSTAFVGDFANFVVGCSFVLPATIIYHIRKNRTTSLLGLGGGTLCLTVFGTAFNALYLIPKFAELYGLPLDTIIGMGTTINSNVKDLISFVIFCVAPLNLLKGIVISLLTMLLYKRVARPLFGK